MGFIFVGKPEQEFGTYYGRAFYYEFHCGTQLPGYLVVIMLWGNDAGDKFKGSFMVSDAHLHSWTLLMTLKFRRLRVVLHIEHFQRIQTLAFIMSPRT